MDSEYLNSLDLEELTGTPQSTWRYWAHVDAQRAPGDEPLGPPSFKLGKRRVWRKDLALKWLAEQEAATSPNASKSPPRATAYLLAHNRSQEKKKG